MKDHQLAGLRYQLPEYYHILCDWKFLFRIASQENDSVIGRNL
jgi:hypothetical protein